MTIKVEREALISVLSRAPSWTLSTTISSEDEEFVVVNLPDKPCVDSGFLRCSSYTDDEDSLCTSSTSSLSTDDSSAVERRVSFAPTLVTDSFTRPYTSREDVPALFYSIEETNRFRQEYRLERKLLSELSIDPDALPLESDLSDLICNPPSRRSPLGRHSISRVVVLHNDKLETFVEPVAAPKEPQLDDFSFDNDAFWSGSLTWY